MSLIPVDVAGLGSGVAGVAGGFAHTCARSVANGLQCWGHNFSGQLGDGTTSQRSVPGDVIGLTLDAAAVAAGPGGQHTCGITVGGVMRCWGRNDSGQVGDGTVAPSRTTPVNVVALTSDTTAAAVGGAHSCALSTAGSLRCWGNNGNGQLGNGTENDTAVPVDVLGMASGVVAVAAGIFHTCALTGSGTVQCWGFNFDGQLGDGTTTNRSTPGAVSGLGGVTALAAGDYFNCALTATGGVKCWGNNEFGQLGDGTTVNRSTPVDVTGLSSGVVAVACGGEHACALTALGIVKCWGRNDFGQLGDGTTVNHTTPVDVSNIGPSPTAVTTASSTPTATRTPLATSTSTSTSAASATPSPTATPEETVVYRWAPIGPFGGIIHALAVDPASGILFAGSNNGGVFRSLDGGVTWKESNEGITNRRINALAVAPGSPVTVYAGSSSGTYKSSDYGHTWSATSLTTLTQALAVDRTDALLVYAATFGGGVYVTTNGGVSWSASNVGLTDFDVRAVAVDPVTHGTVYAGTLNGGVFKSTDSGVNWTPVNTGLANIHIRSIAVDPQNGSVVYAGTFGGVFKSTTGAATWAASSNGLGTRTTTAMAIDPAMPSNVYAATAGSGVFRSTNAGSTWTVSVVGLTNFADQNVEALALDPSNGLSVHMGTFGGGIFASTDGAVTWTPGNAGLSAHSVIPLVVNPTMPNIMYAGANVTGVFKTTDTGANWILSLPSQSARALAIDPQNPSTVFAGISCGGVFKTFDSGAIWVASNSGLTSPCVQALAIDPVTPSTLYAGTNSGIFKSTDTAASWTLASTGLTSTNVTVLVVNPGSPAVVYTGTSGGVFRSTDGGANWVSRSIGLTNLTVSAIAIDASLSSTLYAGVGNGIFKTVDGGASWTRISSTILSATGISIDPLSPSTIYARNSSGVFRSTNAGSTWLPINDGLSNTVSSSGIGVAVDPVTPSRLYSATAGNSVFSYRPSCVSDGQCSDGDQCTIDTCAPLSVGSDGDGCVHTLLACAAQDQCHTAGTCNPVSGVCSNPLRPNGTLCDDANACTGNDACQAGWCTGGTTVVCGECETCDTGVGCVASVCTATATPTPTAMLAQTSTVTPTQMGTATETMSPTPTDTHTPIEAEDLDSDGVADQVDNCPAVFNPDQRNADAADEVGSPLGDVCDPCPADPADQCDPDGTAAATIDVGGGTISTANGCAITIPAGAVSEPTSVAITGGFTQSSYGLGTTLTNVVGQMSELGPEVFLFTQDVGVTLPWPDADDDGIVDGTAPGINESDLKAWRNGKALGTCANAPAVLCTEGPAACPSGQICTTTLPACPGQAACVIKSCAQQGCPSGSALCCEPTGNTWLLMVRQFSEYAVGRDTCVPMTSSRLKLKKLDTSASDDRLTFRGTFVLAPPDTPMNDVAPSTHGLTLVLTGNRQIAFALTLPPGQFEKVHQRGWSTNAAGTRWTYRDKSINPPSGIFRVIVDDQGDVAPGQLRITLKGKNESYATGDPIAVYVKLPDTSNCSVAEFPGPPPQPSCVASRNQSKLTCQ